MTEFLTPVTSYLSDKTNKISNKVLIICGFLFLIILIDNTLGFSYYYSSEKKISKVNSLNEVIEKTKDSVVKVQLITIQKNIIQRRSIKDKFINLFYQADLSGEKLSFSWKQLISECWAIFLIFGFLAIAMILDQEMKFVKRIFAFAVMVLLGFLLSLSFLFIYTHIPHIKWQWLNVSFNLFAQVLYIWFILIIIDPKGFYTGIKKIYSKKLANT